MQFLAESFEVAPIKKSTWPPLRKGGKDYARTMISSALNDDDDGVKRIIVVDGDETVGAASYYMSRERGTKDVVLDRLGSLAPGVGTALLQYVITDAKKMGADRIVLWSSEDADTWYYRFGFEDMPGDQDGGRVLDLRST